MNSLASVLCVTLLVPPAGVQPHAPPLPWNYLPRHPFPHGHPGLRDETEVAGVGTDRSAATIRNELGREYACIENIDRQVGRVLDRLAALGELDRTYVVFTADHGVAVGRHGLLGKQNLYEHSSRPALCARSWNSTGEPGVRFRLFAGPAAHPVRPGGHPDPLGDRGAELSPRAGGPAVADS